MDRDVVEGVASNVIDVQVPPISMRWLVVMMVCCSLLYNLLSDWVSWSMLAGGIGNDWRVDMFKWAKMSSLSYFCFHLDAHTTFIACFTVSFSLFIPPSPPLLCFLAWENEVYIHLSVITWEFQINSHCMFFLNWNCILIFAILLLWLDAFTINGVFYHDMPNSRFF